MDSRVGGATTALLPAASLRFPGGAELQLGATLGLTGSLA